MICYNTYINKVNYKRIKGINPVYLSNQGILNLPREAIYEIARLSEREQQEWEERIAIWEYSTGDLKQRENELQHNLELITSIAQRIDNENRQLIKQNVELK